MSDRTNGRKYHLTLLCGGKSMMLTPIPPPSVDMGIALSEFADTASKMSPEMIEFCFEGIRLTLYPNGSIMFYHYRELDAAYAIADRILDTVSGA